MQFNLEHQNSTRERVGYFPYTSGINRNGEECIMVVFHDPSSSGCSPYYWKPMEYGYYGCEFRTQEEAEYQAKYARGRWETKSVNSNEVKVSAIKFTVISTAVNMDDYINPDEKLSA